MSEEEMSSEEYVKFCERIAELKSKVEPSKMVAVYGADLLFLINSIEKLEKVSINGARAHLKLIKEFASLRDAVKQQNDLWEKAAQMAESVACAHGAGEVGQALVELAVEFRSMKTKLVGTGT